MTLVIIKAPPKTKWINGVRFEDLSPKAQMKVLALKKKRGLL